MNRAMRRPVSYVNRMSLLAVLVAVGATSYAAVTLAQDGGNGAGSVVSVARTGPGYRS